MQAEWLGIDLQLGVFMPHLPDDNMVDRAIELPPATDRRFWLNDSAWEFPTYEDADTFVARLVREGLLVRDPVVGPALAVSHRRCRRARSSAASCAQPGYHRG